jgi:hypothetical protein
LLLEYQIDAPAQKAIPRARAKSYAIASVEITRRRRATGR